MGSPPAQAFASLLTMPLTGGGSVTGGHSKTHPREGLLVGFQNSLPLVPPPRAKPETTLSSQLLL